MNDRHLPVRPAAPARVDVVLPAGARLGPFEVQRLIARGASSLVYLATDHALAMPVALQEYLPMRLVYRDAWLHLHPSDAGHEDVLSRGMRTFIDESRLLARCEHPALVRVNHLFESNGTAYRVMPFQPGQRLADVRSGLTEPPAEGPLRALLEPLLGALETIHHLDQVHGGVSAANILLIDNDFPLLLSPGAAAREIRSDLVQSLMATVESQPGALLPDAIPTGPSIDLCALADVMRFCITGDTTPQTRPRETLAALIARQTEVPWPVYSSEFIGTLDAATSSSAEDWPTSAAQFRLWLTHGTPAARALAPRRSLAPSVAARPAPTASAADAIAFEHATPNSVGEPLFKSLTTDEPGGAMFTDEPPLSRPAASRRWLGLPTKLLFGGVLTGLAVGIIAWASGAWTVAPAIPLERDAMAPLTRIQRPAAPVVVEKAPVASDATPVATPVPSPASMVPSDPVAPSAPIEKSDPERLLADHPPGAGKAKPHPVARAKTHTRVATSAPRPPPDPRAACAGRTEFALYRCMTQQCDTVKWSSHPQCIRLRLDNRAG